ncbi:uncharacterized protein LOC144885041 [Branchiostoma floridae x Branchiostoma japonicum]
MGARSPTVSPTSPFGGSMPDVLDVDSNDGQRHQSRIPQRSQSFQLGQQRPTAFNITRRDQGKGEHFKYPAAGPSIGVRSPTVSPTSPFGGSVPDVNSSDGQRRQSRIPASSQSFQLGQQRPANIPPRDPGLTRTEGLMRRRGAQNERVQYWNSKLIMHEKKRIQISAVENWLKHYHQSGQAPTDRRRHYSDTGGYQRDPYVGSTEAEISSSSHFGGSMPDLQSFKGKHYHGSLWSRGTTESSRKLSELGAIGEGVEESLPEDVRDEHIESGKGQAAKLREKFPSTSTQYKDKRISKHSDGSRSALKGDIKVDEVFKAVGTGTKALADNSINNRRPNRSE